MGALHRHPLISIYPNAARGQQRRASHTDGHSEQRSLRNAPAEAGPSSVLPRSSLRLLTSAPSSLVFTAGPLVENEGIYGVACTLGRCLHFQSNGS